MRRSALAFFGIFLLVSRLAIMVRDAMGLADFALGRQVAVIIGIDRYREEQFLVLRVEHVGLVHVHRAHIHVGPEAMPGQPGKS